MLSQQTARPTMNTLMVAMSYEKRCGAMVPVGTGKTQWEEDELSRWATQLRSDAALQAIGFSVLPSLPYSRTLIRGKWRYGTFPKPFLPFFNELEALILDKDPDAFEGWNERDDVPTSSLLVEGGSHVA
jgi:hypothetical protein